jgi:hypothetical protein
MEILALLAIFSLVYLVTTRKIEACPMGGVHEWSGFPHSNPLVKCKKCGRPGVG